ncbi:MAG TPA: tyrosine-type recombinase/integrase [Solirubrobacteraceae bacterium]|nr:tyrosine-type recombinase/integrase [Solirubrobacteraceae bacterium]
MARKHKRVAVERGLYRAGDVWWACATPKGQRNARWLRVGDVGIQEARRARDEFAYKLNAGHTPARARRLTVDEVQDDWFAHLDELQVAGELRPRTVASYKDGVRLHFMPTFASRQLASITPDDFVDWHDNQRRSGAAAWSIRARWMGIRGLFGYAARTGLILANPCDLLVRRERPKPGRAKQRYLTTDEMRNLLQRASGQGSTVIPLLLFSGLRASEVLGLTWSEIDFADQVIRVRHQMSRTGERVPVKTDAGRRDVILMDELAQVLRKRRLAARFSQPEDLVLGNGVGNTLGYTRLLRAFSEAADAAELRGVTPHTCRHTFASILIDQGATVEFVSDQLGHATTKTTWDIYVHLFRRREHAETARQELNAAFGPMLRSVGYDGDVK